MRPSSMRMIRSASITEVMRFMDAQIFDIDVERTKVKDNKYPNAIFILKLSAKNHSHSSMLTSLAELPCVHSVQELIS